jgi:mRNA interferase RelE/StbE
MIYEIKLNKKVDKFLKNHHIIAENFRIKMLDLAYNRLNNLDIKKLEWKDNCFRLRIWKYRFLYKIIENRILIFFYDAGSRWDIYK